MRIAVSLITCLVLAALAGARQLVFPGLVGLTAAGWIWWRDTAPVRRRRRASSRALEALRDRYP